MASDMRLNDKPIAKDGAYIYAEAADGSQVKISKADLAAVVAGIMNVKKDFPFMFRGFVVNADEAKGSGIYRVNNKSTNVPTLYGVLMVFATEDYVAQCIISAAGYGLSFRIFSDGLWQNWIKVANENQ